MKSVITIDSLPSRSLHPGGEKKADSEKHCDDKCDLAAVQHDGESGSGKRYMDSTCLEQGVSC